MEIVTVEAMSSLITQFEFPIAVSIIFVALAVYLILKISKDSSLREKRIAKEAKDREERAYQESKEREERLLEDFKKRDKINSVREDKLMTELKEINQTNKQLVETSRVITEGLTEEFRNMKNDMTTKFNRVEVDVKQLGSKMDTIIDVVNNRE